ncbi:MAG TPA: acylphosphatase [Stellaceae bacterium]|nr:acylphosphatase [Stellaceae bacterium]
MKTVRLRITGRVQAVGYRAWAVALGRRLALRGWVRNRADGSVELLATGAEDAVAAMIAASREGPEAARVDAVHATDEEDDGSSDFTFRPTD